MVRGNECKVIIADKKGGTSKILMADEGFKLSAKIGYPAGVIFALVLFLSDQDAKKGLVHRKFSVKRINL